METEKCAYIDKKLTELKELAESFRYDAKKPLYYYIVVINELEKMGKDYIYSEKFDKAFVSLARMLIVIILYIPKHPDYNNVKCGILESTLNEMKLKYSSITNKLRILLRKIYENEYVRLNLIKSKAIDTSVTKNAEINHPSEDLISFDSSRLHINANNNDLISFENKLNKNSSNECIKAFNDLNINGYVNRENHSYGKLLNNFTHVLSNDTATSYSTLNKSLMSRNNHNIVPMTNSYKNISLLLDKASLSGSFLEIPFPKNEAYNSIQSKFQSESSKRPLNVSNQNEISQNLNSSLPLSSNDSIVKSESSLSMFNNSSEKEKHKNKLTMQNIPRNDTLAQDIYKNGALIQNTSRNGISAQTLFRNNTPVKNTLENTTSKSTTVINDTPIQKFESNLLKQPRIQSGVQTGVIISKPKNELKLNKPLSSNAQKSLSYTTDRTFNQKSQPDEFDIRNSQGNRQKIEESSCPSVEKFDTSDFPESNNGLSSKIVNINKTLNNDNAEDDRSSSHNEDSLDSSFEKILEEVKEKYESSTKVEYDRSLKPQDEEASNYIVTLSNKSSSANNTKEVFVEHEKEHNVIIPANTVQEFIYYASEDLSRNVETLGIIAGKLVGEDFIVTHIVLPKQKGTSDTCEMLNESDLFLYQIENELLTLGWIHTHPSQSCFLSSVDLHTQYAYQCQLKEAIAIVAAYEKNDFNVFRLTKKGMEEVKNCNKRGFHIHGWNMFEVCKNANFYKNRSIKVVDLRK